MGQINLGSNREDLTSLREQITIQKRQIEVLKAGVNRVNTKQSVADMRSSLHSRKTMNKQDKSYQNMVNRITQ
jgi:hypothetical protein